MKYAACVCCAWLLACPAPAQDKAEETTVRDIGKKLMKPTKDLEGKAFRITGFSTSVNGIHVIDRKDKLTGFDLNSLEMVYLSGKKLNKKSVTFVAPMDLTDELREFMRGKNGDTLIELTLTCKIERRDAFWVANVSEIQVTAVGAKKIAAKTFKLSP